MIRALPEYLSRGGTKSAIAEAWGKSPQYIGLLTNSEPDMFFVEFNPLNPKNVLKLWKRGYKKTIDDEVYFDHE